MVEINRWYGRVDLMYASREVGDGCWMCEGGRVEDMWIDGDVYASSL